MSSRSEKPDDACSERNDPGQRIRPIIEAFAARLPAVRVAYLRRDGAVLDLST